MVLFLVKKILLIKLRLFYGIKKNFYLLLFLIIKERMNVILLDLNFMKIIYLIGNLLI